MFHNYHRPHGAAFMIMTLASIAMTLPFMSYMKRMANSLEKIANKRYS
ncbi:hypothetical protein [Desulforamulus reducens]|nr:hypothetical protein [Desulforamulus reducens]